VYTGFPLEMATNALGRETSVIKAEADYVEGYPGSGSGSSLSPADEAIDRMSPEERTAKVCLQYPTAHVNRAYTVIRSIRLTTSGTTTGKETTPQTRPQADPMALSSLLDEFLGQDEHRQC